MIVTHKVKIDLLERGAPAFISAVQSDEYSREVAFSLFSGGVAWTPDTGTTAVVSFGKSDGTGGQYDSFPNGEAAYSISGNVVTVGLAPQVLTAPGRANLSVGLVVGSSVLYTFPVEIDVQRNPGLNATSDNYFKIAGALADSGWEANMYLGTDADGNVVAVEAPGGGASVSVKTVNGISPDDNGNIDVDVGVLTVNGTEPDENGNVEVEIVDTQPTTMDLSTFDSGTFSVDGQTYTWVDADGGTTGDPVTFTRPDGTTLTVTW